MAPADLALLSREEIAAAFDPERAPQDWRNDNARLAIVSPPPRIVAASPDMLAFFGADDFDALEARLMQGEGPSARRLRNLAATLPVSAPSRLERMGFVLDRRPTSVNLRCARVSGPGGATWLLVSVPALGAASLAPPTPADVRDAPKPDEPRLPDFGESPPPKSRFLWILDQEGRFGVAHPALAAAVGANAPRRSETVETLLRRVKLERGGELVRVIAERQTFSDIIVGWPLLGGDRRRLVALSAAPQFGRHREFLGYRGFGVLGEEVGAPRPREAALAPERAEEALSRETTLEPSPTPGAAPFANGSVAASEAASPAERPFAPLAEAPAPQDDTASLMSDSGPAFEDRAAAAGLAGETPPHDEPRAEPDGQVSELVETYLEAAHAEHLEASPPREAPLAADGSESAPALPETGEIAGRASAAEVIATHLETAHAEHLEASPPREAPLAVDGSEPAALPETGEIAGRASAAEAIATHLETAHAEHLEAEPPREASLAADGSGSAALPETGQIEGRGSAAEVIARHLETAHAEHLEAPTLTDAGEAGAAQADPPQPDLTGRTAASDAPPAPAERTAEIYVLRQPGPATALKIVPIRPESVELSRSERDAFREIARALVGRPPSSRDDRTGETDATNPVASARGLLDLAFGPPVEPTAAKEGELAASGGSDAEEVRRNAGAVLDRLPIGVLVARDARALYVNRTLLDLVGYRDFAHFQASEGLTAMFCGRDPQGMTTEDAGAVPIVRADGQTLSVDGHAQAIGWDGSPATLIALRPSREAELQARLRAVEQEASMRNGAASDIQAMLDRATDGAVTLDSAGRILSLNHPAERLFGYDQNEIAGESVLMLLAPQSHPETTARLESLSRTGESEALLRPLQVVGRDRSGAPLALAMTLARIGPSEAPHFCALVRDLSRDREAERRLIAARDAAEAASAAKTDFLAQVSHEIRTPLHAILGFAEVMMEERFGPVGNERYKDYLKDIHASGAHVMSLADDLLDLSKIEAGKLELSFAPVDANGLIRECVSLMQPQAARERVIVRVSLYDRLPRVMVDERSLKQIMLNLMSNAVKFNEPGGQVIISTAVDAAGQAVIRVRDTGVGMNETEVGLALAPFSQVGRAHGKNGAGLGLPLTKALVEANKAEFSIKSRREQGTLIEIAFPNVQAAQ
jgi:PAS domain S-box-containing protein